MNTKGFLIRKNCFDNDATVFSPRSASHRANVEYRSYLLFVFQSLQICRVGVNGNSFDVLYIPARFASESEQHAVGYMRRGVVIFLILFFVFISIYTFQNKSIRRGKRGKGYSFVPSNEALKSSHFSHITSRERLITSSFILPWNIYNLRIAIYFHTRLTTGASLTKMFSLPSRSLVGFRTRFQCVQCHDVVVVVVVVGIQFNDGMVRS